MAELTVLIETTGCNTYVGEAPVRTAQTSTEWRLLRVQENTSGTIISYADNETTFTKAWSERNNYDYTVS